MKGIVFNLLEETVRQEHGEDAWDSLLEAADLEGSFTSLGNYPDVDLMKLVAAASSALALPQSDILRWFGRRALPLLAERYPLFFQGHKNARSFLLTLNDVIHPEVRKIYPDATVPEFQFDASSPEVLVMIYQSERRLCALAEGFIEGATDHYGEAATVLHTNCMHRGADSCVLRLSFGRRDR